uniref:Cytochrome f n=1 Tax=Galaxaura rugosa TaxID=268570 RepID=A0A1G4NSY5_9FLOR|nr:Apocytochrome f [Galaxaura rugosa]SCW21770.1 Apocytochrome f [Galaxaura rugosa]
MRLKNSSAFYKITRILTCLCLSVLTYITVKPYISYAFPIYAQQAYENPREATGRIVCANCHLTQKPAGIELPQAVLPNTVFEAIVKIPYDNEAQQILGNGSKGPLNVGAVVILPKGFKLAPSKIIPDEIKSKIKGVYIQPYSTKQDNILVVGPLPGDTNKEIIFPILSPDPSKDKGTSYLKYSVFVGANRGRGQVYPTGDKTNNNTVNASTNGKVVNIENLDKGGYKISIEKPDQTTIIDKIPKGLELKVKTGDFVTTDQVLTFDPNVGGFGQNEAEIVLQSPARIKGMIAFFITVTLAQIFFVLKKKQWEKVQAAEINF